MAGSSEARIGIINVSDRAAAGIYEDLPGKAVVAALGEYLLSPWSREYRVIPDERDQLTAAMIELADDKGCCLIVTTGGTVRGARRHAGGHRGRVREDAAGVRRADAPGQPAVRAHRDPVAADRRRAPAAL